MTQPRPRHSEQQRTAAIAAVISNLSGFVECIPLLFGDPSQRRLPFAVGRAVFTAQLLRTRLLTEFLIGRPKDEADGRSRWKRRSVHAIDFIDETDWPPSPSADVDLLAAALDDLDARTCHLSWHGVGKTEHHGSNELCALARVFRAFFDRLSHTEPERAAQLRQLVERFEEAVRPWGE